MATRGKIKAIEIQQGRPISQILIELHEKHSGNQRAMGEALGISQATISLWIMRSGLREKKVLAQS